MIIASRNTNTTALDPPKNRVSSVPGLVFTRAVRPRTAIQRCSANWQTGTRAFWIWAPDRFRIICSALLFLYMSSFTSASGPAFSEQARKARLLLDDPAWHLSDPWISRYRAEEASSDPARRAEGRVLPAIQAREREAFASLISADIPDTEKTQLCNRYITHRNEGVAQLAFSGLIRRQAWAPIDVIRFAVGEHALDRWNVALTSLPKSMRRSDRIAIARAAMEAALAVDPFVDSRRAVLELAAVRVLVLSEFPDDHDHVRKALERYPDIPLFWVAVSRNPLPEPLRESAVRIHTDTTQPVELRLAAALVAGKNDVRASNEAMERIHGHLQGYYSESWIRWLKDTATRPRTDPEVSGRWEQLSLGNTLFAVLRELPDDVLKKHMSSMLDEAPHGRGILLPIFARRVPEDLVNLLSRQGVDSSVFGALYLAAYFKPELAVRVRTLIPKADYQTLEAKVAQEGVDSLAGLATTITLWD